MHCGIIVISGWNSSGCNCWLLRLPLVCCWWSGTSVCSCILSIAETSSNFSVLPVVLLLALKVCVPCGGSHKCNLQFSSLHFIPPPPFVLHLFDIPAIKILHGFQSVVAVGYFQNLWVVSKGSFKVFNCSPVILELMFGVFFPTTNSYSEAPICLYHNWYPDVLCRNEIQNS